MSIFPNDPGSWLQYLNKEENKGIPILEVKNKYNKELLLWENFLSSKRLHNLIQHQKYGTHGGDNPTFTYPPFVLQWTTTGTDEVATLGLSDNGTTGTFTYDFRINWGDGSADEFYTDSANITHTYATPGVYTSSIYGTFPAMNMDNITPENLSGVISWGSSPWESLSEAFRDQSNLTTFNPMDRPVFSYPASLGYIFVFATLPSDFNIIDWNTRNVTNMDALFAFTDFSNFPNIYLGDWDTSNVNRLEFLFYNQFKSLVQTIQGFENWDVSKVITMQYAFSGIGDVTSLNLRDWDTSNVTNMTGIFRFDSVDVANRGSLSDLDLRGWDFSNVKKLNASFFCHNSNPDQGENINVEKLNINNWDVGKVENFSFAFGGFNGDLEVVGTGSKPPEGVALDLSNWDVSNVTNMENMFDSAFISSIGDVGSWNTGKVTNFADMFQFCSILEDINVASWDTSVATRMDDMFLSCSSLSSLNITNWNTSNVENMRGTFQNLSGITTLDFSNWDYSSVTNMTDFLTGTSITTDDYSTLLNRITATSAATGITLGGGTNTYNVGASASRATLVTAGWTITDGGQV